MENYQEPLPVISITDSQILIYKEYQNGYTRSDDQKKTEKNLTRGVYNGYMSPKTRAKVKKYLSTWLEGIQDLNNNPKYKYLKNKPFSTFFTGTLSAKQSHSDNVIKRKILMPFIERLKRTENVRYYFWRAEAQKNGNIHFHILIDCYVHHTRIRDLWNHYQDKLGYISKFEKIHKHRNPNSTDIHSLKIIKNITSYVIKYCCKSDGNRPIKGRIHGCSDELKNLTPYQDLLSSDYYNLVTDCINEENSMVHNDDNFTVITCDVRSVLEREYKDMYKEYLKDKIDKILYLYNYKKVEYETRLPSKHSARPAPGVPCGGLQLKLFTSLF